MTRTSFAFTLGLAVLVVFTAPQLLDVLSAMVVIFAAGIAVLISLIARTFALSVRAGRAVLGVLAVGFVLQLLSVSVLPLMYPVLCLTVLALPTAAPGSRLSDAVRSVFRKRSAITNEV